MKRLGNFQTIADIEFVIDSPVPSDRRHTWTAYGVTCTRALFSTTGGLSGEMGDKLRKWMRAHKQYEDSPTLDPKAVCERARNESYRA